ncbi:hypothetical protein D9758_002747 [Tetrapyrgos nigripes]|uniref:Uncharacterized protein n=1 Tax=Tetrapyrgos nigripes TaxID=182062 RepID=A0A8H5LTU6_9AGAR|nr:hypothetical protein D9758_002747 [Tetrapyrgos nigripes]
MKSFLFLPAFFLCALSQSIQIISPSDGTAVTPGQDLTVQLGFPNSLTGVQHVSVVISMFNCAGEPCPVSSSGAVPDSLGSPLFMGGFDPEFHEGALPPYQNFTVSLPDAITGTNMISVAHFMLLGAGAEPIFEFKNSTVQIGQSSSRRAIRGRVV